MGFIKYSQGLLENFLSLKGKDLSPIKNAPGLMAKLSGKEDIRCRSQG
jgi:hypothetical protein